MSDKTSAYDHYLVAEERLREQLSNTTLEVESDNLFVRIVNGLVKTIAQKIILIVVIGNLVYFYMEVKNWVIEFFK